MFPDRIRFDYDAKGVDVETDEEVDVPSTHSHAVSDWDVNERGTSVIIWLGDREVLMIDPWQWMAESDA